MSQLFSEQLKEYKENYSLTVQKLADKIGIPKRTVENWLSGKTIPTEITQYGVIEKLNKNKGED